MWFTVHVPIVSALTIVGDASAELIKDNLEVPEGVRWIFCGGYSVAMIGIWGLAMLDTDEDEPGEIWFPMVCLTVYSHCRLKSHRFVICRKQGWQDVSSVGS